MRSQFLGFFCRQHAVLTNCMKQAQDDHMYEGAQMILEYRVMTGGVVAMDADDVILCGINRVMIRPLTS
jgi:hypothetical protein